MTPQNTIIVVNEEPYCIWEADLIRRNLEFIEGIDVDYFEYLLNLHLNSEDEKRASIALRTALHHAVETFFSLLGAYIQAPDCVYAWVAKCHTEELRSLIEKILNSNQKVFTKLNIETVSLSSVAELIFHGYMPNTERADSTKKLFSKFWAVLANEFLDEKNIAEYNSLKHGFRVKSGGFSLSVGVEHQFGVSPPEDEMKLLGGSQYGTSFLRLEPIAGLKNNKNLRSKKVSLNWKVECVALQLQLVCMSINNVISALKIVNGTAVAKCKFVRPIEDSDFEKPWSFTPSVRNLSMDFVMDETPIGFITKAELNDILSAHKEEGKSK